jgi:hypothetical protein
MKNVQNKQKIFLWIVVSVVKIAFVSILGSLMATRFGVGEYSGKDSFCGISKPNLHYAFIDSLYIFTAGIVLLLSLTRFKIRPCKTTTIAIFFVAILVLIRWVSLCAIAIV